MNPNTIAPVYSYNTGQRLENGQPQDKYNSLTGQQIGNPISIPNATPISPTVNASLIGTSSRLSLPQLPVNTTASGIIAGTGSQASQSQAQIQQAQQNVAEIQKAQGASEADKAQSEIIKAAREALNMEQTIQTNQANQEASQINPIQQTLNDINTQIADQQIAYRAEQDKIRSTPMSVGQAQVNNNAIEDTYGRRLADLAIRQSAAQGNIDSIRSNFERQTKLLIQPYENELRFQQTFAQKYADSLSTKENKQLELVMDERKSLIQQTKDLQNAKAQMIQEISKNGGGADQATIQAVQNATDVTEIAQAGSKYVGRQDLLNSQLDRQLKQAQLNKIYSDINSAKNPQVLASQVNQLTQLGDPKTNKQAISAILAGKGIEAGTKGRIAPANEVMNAVEEFTANRQNGGFTGVGGLGYRKEKLKGFFNQKSPEAIYNQGQISALNLKVQQWASGANLSTQQTKEALNMVPSDKDSDKVVRTKLNTLYNFMANNVESGLLTDGVNINFKPVNLFETYDLIQQASPEQREQLKTQGYLQ